MYTENPAEYNHRIIDDVRGHLLPQLKSAHYSLVLNTGKRGGVQDPVIQVEPPIRPKRGKPRRTASLLTSTSKMSCLSFSMPAGAKLGTCQAEALQRQGRNYFGALDHDVVGNVEYDPSRFICKMCYAGKSRYVWPSVQISQTVRKYWCKQMMREGPGALSDALTEAIIHAMSNTKMRSKQGHDPKFFRWHDSGDFFSTAYAEEIFQVCRNLPEINFWAPTRQWVFERGSPFTANPSWAELFENVPENLALRPSALQFEDPAPSVPGLAEGSTAGKHFDGVRADYDCPAYRHDGKTCAGALKGATAEELNILEADMGYDPGNDCRACWLAKGVSITYTEH